MLACVFREDNRIDITDFRRFVRIGKGLTVFLYKFPSSLFRVFRFGDFIAEYNIDRSVGTHYRDLGGGVS